MKSNFRIQAPILIVSIFTISLSLLGSVVHAQSDSSVYYSEKIQMDSVRADIEYLSSSKLQGRSLGSNGLAEAGRYVADRIGRTGVRPVRTQFGSLSFYQPFFLYSDTVLPRLKIGKTTYKFGTGFHTFFPLNNTIKAKKLVFLTENIESWEKDPERIRDQVVVFIPGYNTDDFSLNRLKECINRAEELRAKAILIPSLKFSQDQRIPASLIPSYMNSPNFLVAYPGMQEFNNRFSLRNTRFNRIPVIYINWGGIRDIMGESALRTLLRDYASAENLKNFDTNVSFRLSKAKITVGDLLLNILGYIPGKNENQIVVVGAHYDHIEKDSTGAFSPGADDNATGVASLLQLAEIFNKAAQNGNRPERSILFAAFSGDETGLSGSTHLEESLENSPETVDAMLNIDMVGRTDRFRRDTSDYIYVLGWDLDPGIWGSISRSVQVKMPGFNPDFSITDKNDKEGLLFSSGQYPFLAKEIPALYFYDGMSDDYHKPTDTADKINWEMLEKRIRFIFLTVWETVYKKGNL